jgi:HEAT repeat protein
MPGILGNLIFDQNESTLAILLSIVGLIVLLCLLQVVGALDKILGFLWRVIERAIERGFRVWEQTLSWADWPVYLLLVAALLAGGIHASNRGWDWVNLLIASVLLASGMTACTAFMLVSMERYEVARGYKAVHNPTKGQELAHHVVRHGARLGPMMLIVSAAATIAGFALLNQALYATIGQSWYRVRDAKIEPGFLDFLAFALIHLMRVVDVLDLARSSQLLDIGFVRQSAWPVTVLLSLFKSFFMLVLLQQIIAAIREQKLLSEMIEDFWSPHAPIHDRARVALGQFGPLAVGPVLRSLGDVSTLTREQRSELPRVLADIGPTSIDMLCQALSHEQPIVRGVAASALGYLRAFEATTALAELCADANENVRACAVEALGLICESNDSSSRLPSQPLPLKRWGLITVGAVFPKLPIYIVRFVWRVFRFMVRGTSVLSERAGEPIGRGVAALRLALTDPVAAVRIQALGALGRIGSRAVEAVADLIERIQTGTDQEQRLAAEALGTVRALPASAIPALIDATRAASPPVRAAAATSLGHYREQATVAGPALVALVDDSQEAVRDAATAAINLIGTLDGAATHALQQKLAHPDNLRRAQTAEALGEMGEAARHAAPALVQSLADHNDLVRGKAAEALGRIGASAAKVAVPALAKSLGDQDNQVKLAAAEALGQMGAHATDAVPELLRSLQHDNSEVRARAVEALGQIRDPQTRPDLETACRDADANVRVAAIRALSALESNVPGTIEVLLRSLTDADPQVRIAAVGAAAACGPIDERIVMNVAALLDDSNEDVAIRAMQALPRFGEAAPRPVLETLGRWLMEDLGGSKPAVAAMTLGRFGPAAHGAGSALAHAAQTGDAAVRHAAIWAIAMIQPPEAAEALIAGLHDEADHVRIQASGGLWKVGTLLEELQSDLLEALHDPHQRVRANVAAALARFETLPAEAESSLIACTTSPLSAVRRFAAAALSQFNSATVRDCLRRMANDPNHRVRETAAESLRTLEPEEMLAEPEAIAAPDTKQPTSAEKFVAVPFTAM